MKPVLIAVAAMLQGEVDLNGDGDIVVLISGRNADEEAFQKWIQGAT